MPKRVDSNHAEIVNALRRCGVTVESLHTLGKGAPDLLCGYRGKNTLLEIKTDRGDLNEQQREWHGNWNGQVDVVRTAEEALAVLGAIKH